MIELKPKEIILVSSKEELPEGFDYQGASSTAISSEIVSMINVENFQS